MYIKKDVNGNIGPIILKEHLVVLKLLSINYNDKGVVLSSRFQRNYIWEKLQLRHSILVRKYDSVDGGLHSVMLDGLNEYNKK